MNIAVFSDTHGNYPAAIRALDLEPEVDAIVHLGDFCDDAIPLQAAVTCPVIRVPGNCDLESRLPREQFLALGGVPFLLCHGDGHGVKRGLSRLVQHAVAIKARVVLFGHTHTPLVEYHDGILFVNPGSLQKGTLVPTFALVSLDNGTPSARIVPMAL